MSGRRLQDLPEYQNALSLLEEMPSLVEAASFGDTEKYRKFLHQLFDMGLISSAGLIKALGVTSDEEAELRIKGIWPEEKREME